MSIQILLAQDRGPDNILGQTFKWSHSQKTQKRFKFKWEIEIEIEKMKGK
jgi:hypothetical protein